MSTTIIAVISTITFFLLYVFLGVPIIIFSYLLEGVKSGIEFFMEVMRSYF